MVSSPLSLWKLTWLWFLTVGMMISSSSPLPFEQTFPLSLTFFLHDNLVTDGNNATVVQVATAAGIRTSVTANSTFGNTNVFSSPIRKTIDKNSTLLGISGGMITTLSDPQQFFYQFTSSYNTSEYQGTISGQGKVSPLQPSWEISIIGGTGDFRAARGYAVVNTFPPADLSDVVFEYKVHLYAIHWYP